MLKIVFGNWKLIHIPNFTRNALHKKLKKNYTISIMYLFKKWSQSILLTLAIREHCIFSLSNKLHTSIS